MFYILPWSVWKPSKQKNMTETRPPRNYSSLLESYFHSFVYVSLFLGVAYFSAEAFWQFQLTSNDSGLSMFRKELWPNFKKNRFDKILLFYYTHYTTKVQKRLKHTYVRSSQLLRNIFLCLYLSVNYGHISYIKRSSLHFRKCEWKSSCRKPRLFKNFGRLWTSVFRKWPILWAWFQLQRLWIVQNSKENDQIQFSKWIQTSHQRLRHLEEKST